MVKIDKVDVSTTKKDQEKTTSKKNILDKLKVEGSTLKQQSPNKPLQLETMLSHIVQFKFKFEKE